MAVEVVAVVVASRERPKVLRVWCVLFIFASKCASRHNGVHFFTINQLPKVVQTWSDVCTFLTSRCASRPQRRALFSSSQLPKVIRAWCVLCILIILTYFNFKMCCGHNGVHFFDSSTSKSAPRKVWNVLRATRCALFRISTSKSALDVRWSLAISLRIVLRATTACNFSFLISPDGSAYAALASYFSIVRSHKSLEKHGKTQCFATFLPFRTHTSSFFWLFLFSDLLSSLLFSDLPTSAFPSVHVVGSLTSKLPSMIYIYTHVYLSICLYVLCTYFTPYIHFHIYIYTYTDIHAYSRWWKACLLHKNPLYPIYSLY